MVIDNVDDAAHSILVNRINQTHKILHRAVLRVDRAIIHDRVRASERALAPDDANGVNRHQPDDVCPKGPDTSKLSANAFKSSFTAELTDENRIHDLTAQNVFPHN